MVHGVSLAFLAAQDGISVRSAYKLLARYRSGGAAALVDRRSARRTQRHTPLSFEQQRVVNLRHVLCTFGRGVGRWQLRSPPLAGCSRHEVLAGSTTCSLQSQCPSTSGQDQ